MRGGQERSYGPGDPISFTVLADEVEATVIEKTTEDTWRVELDPPGSGLVIEVHLQPDPESE